MNTDNSNSKWLDKMKQTVQGFAALAQKCKNGKAKGIEKAKGLCMNADVINRLKKGFSERAMEFSQSSDIGRKLAGIYSNKRIFYPAASAIAVITLSAGVYFSTLSYALYIDGKEVGVVGSKSDVYNVVEQIKRDVPEEFGNEIKIGQSIEMKPVHVSKAQLMAKSQLEKSIKESIDMQVDACGINIDGQIVTVLKTSKQAQQLLKKLKEPYESKDAGVLSRKIEFVQKVKVEKVQANISDIKTVQRAAEYLLQGTDKLQKYKVKQGDSAWTVARALDIHVDDIQKANPDIDVEKLQIDQEINVTVLKPYISIKTVDDITYDEKIPYETVYEDTTAMYKGDQKVKTDGQEGLKKVSALQVKVDGQLVSTNVKSEEVVQAPSSKVVIQGVKERPKTLAFGSFINPTRGRLTSPFGRRWGRMHTGIDIANAIGTAIYAADGGKVTYAGWQNGYGKVVIISHENGYQTYYAHCSSIDVSKGTRVYRGQKIAEIGNTGRSTGPHLHFEVRKNGTPQNPSSYVGY